jgi:uncharacterized protein (UPF0248 family)
LARRRSRIREAINRAIHTGMAHRLRVVYRHRVEGVGERLVEIPLSMVVKVDSWALHLAGGDVIPLHRVVELRDEKGRVVWRRGEGWVSGE